MDPAVVLVVAASFGSAAIATTPPDVPSEEDLVGEWNGTRYRLPGGPDWLAADDEHVYIRRDSGQVDVVEPSSGTIVRSVEIPSELCQGIGVGADRVWTCVDTDVISFDPTTGEVGEPLGIVKTYEQGHLPVAFGRLWVLVGDAARSQQSTRTPERLPKRSSSACAASTWVSARPASGWRANPTAAETLSMSGQPQS